MGTIARAIDPCESIGLSKLLYYFCGRWKIDPVGTKGDAMTRNVIDIASRSRGDKSPPLALETSALVAVSVLETLFRLLAEKGVLSREKAESALRIAARKARNAG